MKHPLLLAALSMAAPLSGQATRTVASAYPIQLYSFGFSPTPIELRAGRQVTLLFVNSSGSSHEFKAPAFFRASKIQSGSISAEGSIELKGHESASVTLVPARGTYRAHCGHFIHKQLGMQDLIYVR